MAPLFGTLRLPKVGTSLNYAFLSHIAVKKENRDVVLPLITEGCRLACQRKLSYVMLGLAKGNPLLPVVQKAFKHRKYRSIVYTVDLSGHNRQKTKQPADEEITHIEIAML